MRFGALDGTSFGFLLGSVEGGRDTKGPDDGEDVGLFVGDSVGSRVGYFFGPLSVCLLDYT